MILLNKIIIDKQELERLYIEEERSTKEIGKIFNTTSKTIVKRLHEFDIPIRQSTTINRKYKMDEHYFDVINSKDKAYLLGLICADGWIGRNDTIGLAFQTKDKELIEFAKDCLKADNPIKEKDNKVEITFHSIVMTNKLIGYGIVPNKSLILNINDVIKKAMIPKELIPSFILGYYDGDGGIYSCLGHNKKTVQWTCGFTGTYGTCLFLKEYFDKGFIVDEKSKSGNTFTYKGSGRNIVASILNKLYNSHEDSFCLKRKKDKFLELKSPLS